MRDTCDTRPSREEILHVLDLPQTYQKPSYEALRKALDLLKAPLQSFDLKDEQESTVGYSVRSEHVPKYLTSIIASPLDWIKDEGKRDELWSQAGERLSERAGRSGMGDITRSFMIDEKEQLSVILHEPSITEDRIGFKTWSSSYVLAKHLRHIKVPPFKGKSFNVMELGAGTGLLGIAAASIWQRHVIMTDLAEIVPNLQRNIDLNSSIFSTNGASASSGILDWRFPDRLQLTHSREEHHTKARIILIADPVYSSEHPKLLVNAITTWLARDVDARLILAHPARRLYEDVITELYSHLQKNGLRHNADEKWIRQSRDDWADDVTHVITMWRWANIF